MLSGTDTHHRGVAGGNPLCPAAYMRFRQSFYTMPQGKSRGTGQGIQPNLWLSGATPHPPQALPADFLFSERAFVGKERGPTEGKAARPWWSQMALVGFEICSMYPVRGPGGLPPGSNFPCSIGRRPADAKGPGPRAVPGLWRPVRAPERSEGKPGRNGSAQ